MSFSATAPSSNVLNGYSDIPSTSTAPSTAPTKKSTTHKISKVKVAKVAKAPKAPKAPKAQTDTSYYFNGSGQSTATTMVATTSTPSLSPDYHKDINNVNLFDYLTWPVVIFLVLIMTAYRMLKKYAQKHPAHGGFAHKHKRRHPGVPEPKIFKSKKK